MAKHEITNEKLEELRQRMAKHDVENDKAVVKLSARELQQLLDAVPPIKEYRVVDQPVPDGDNEQHLYSVTIVVSAIAAADPNVILQHVASACLQHPSKPLAVVAGYGGKVSNLTLSSKANRLKSNRGMVCTGITNKPIAKKATTVPMIVPVST